MMARRKLFSLKKKNKMLDDFFIINIGDYITKDGVVLGEDVVRNILSAFSCVPNIDNEVGEETDDTSNSF